MSKAFTREDGNPEPLVLPRLVSLLPPGAKNYLTPAGAQQLRAELARLVERELPAVRALPESDEQHEQSLRLEQRIAHLQQSLVTAEVVAPPLPPHEVVRFGATVTVRESRQGESTYRIVGVDETDLDRNWVSWLSPIARALMNARLGQRVPFKFPTGATDLEIVGIVYE
ncbi:MAG TPA: GreA/GreB family elongation factor [Candidatus Didemnitutus sp.]|nr:GreA/GreB family elongation factor [Candidatus Didemnitutus sp.]